MERNVSRGTIEKYVKNEYKRDDNMRKRVEGNVVDVYNRKIFPGVVCIEDGHIVSIKETKKCYKNYILPGFIDAHVHIESSMLIPTAFSELALKKGTVAVVNDPHEVANVLGKEGIYFMLMNSRDAFIKMFFTIPSCVPATDFDSSGDILSSDDIMELAKSGQFIGLSEMMNVPGILYSHLETMRKIEIAKHYHMPIDGHAPELSGENLEKYVQAGITTDHECVSLEEAIEKIHAGMNILIREGSAAKNYQVLKTLISLYPDRVMFCTDDSHPDDIIQEGHIDKIVKKAIADGFDLFDVLKIASINPIQHYNLNVGTLREGDTADFIVVKDLNSFVVQSVYISGEEKYNISKNENKNISTIAPLNKFNRGPISVLDLQYPVEDTQVCIGIQDGEIVTKKEIFTLPFAMTNFESDVEKDILKIVYLNRYQNTPLQIAYIRGIGLKKGAFATTISHDSHNIIAVGTTDKELAEAINAVIREKGGLSVVDGDKVTVLSLPIAGIMTDKNGYEVAKLWNTLIDQLHEMGCILNSPFMTLSFMALIVIPELKIGEKGLFEYSKFRFISKN